MTYELINIFAQAVANQKAGRTQVLATVVDLDGSSYRKPGVRMLMDDQGNMTGAVSGGCVEKEVLRRAQTVFETGQAKMMTYDGRYRLGCEGVLFILLEPLELSESLLNAFSANISKRVGFEVVSYFERGDEIAGAFGSFILFSDQKHFSFSKNEIKSDSEKMLQFSQSFSAQFKLLIIGGEHDTVKLCQMASLLGWDVEIITSWKDPKQLSDFPGASKVDGVNPEIADLSFIDPQTAVVLMSHNFSTDLKYLIKLKDQFNFSYLGVIGSNARRDRLMDKMLELYPNTSLEFIEKIHSPAGLNIGAITPEEIGLSILSEILCTIRKKIPVLSE